MTCHESTRDAVERICAENARAQLPLALAAAAIERAAADLERLADKLPQHEERSNR